MHNARDTFLYYLKNNLTIPVNHIYRSSTNMDAGKLQPNALNVEFSNARVGSTKRPSQWTVYLDVMNDDELTAVDWFTQVWQLLGDNPQIPKYDYTNPASPVLIPGYKLFWDYSHIDFKPLKTESSSARYHAQFFLKQFLILQ